MPMQPHTMSNGSICEHTHTGTTSMDVFNIITQHKAQNYGAGEKWAVIMFIRTLFV